MPLGNRTPVLAKAGCVHHGGGYAGGCTATRPARSACSGRIGHSEVVQVVFDPAVVSYQQLLRAFCENRDPTQAMRQHDDIASQYRSAIYATSPGQAALATAGRDAYASALSAARRGPLGRLYPAENYHQQYVETNPRGYCNLHGTGIACSITGTRGLGVSAPQ